MWLWLCLSSSFIWDRSLCLFILSKSLWLFLSEESQLHLPFLRVMAFGRRGLVVLWHVLFLYPQGLGLLGLSPMCALMLCPSCCTFRPVVHRGSLCLSRAVRIWFLAWMWYILTWCAQVCLWNEICCHCHWNCSLRKLLVREMQCGLGFRPVLLGRGPAVLGLENHDWKGQFHQSVGVGFLL